jgi:dienelactone hydrolase
MFSRRFLTLLLLTLVAAFLQAAPAEQASIPGKTTAGQQIQLPGLLHKPNGSGPFPAVVMLSGCTGYAGERDATQQLTWAQQLVSWGYVALQVDSFTPRGYPNGVCENPSAVSSNERSNDAYAAKAYLSATSFVDSKRVAVIGWSHGGMAVMKIIDSFLRDKTLSPFKAAIAIYPWCTTPNEPDTPVLVLIGAKDDWCPVDNAEMTKKAYEVRDDWKTEFALTIYPNAYHAFDYETPPGGVVFLGHHIEYDPVATSDAISRTKDFLDRYCMP